MILIKRRHVAIRIAKIATGQGRDDGGPRERRAVGHVQLGHSSRARHAGQPGARHQSAGGAKVTRPCLSGWRVVIAVRFCY
ncbi:hypothetical protein RPC_3843 [Rhodopseudomonas palustris BisB18]|uniref:Uncharacterized protein n=1 Tax=Rhodopseudomonas palustris (strain BisB18) TaxID=316056 RepID=Q20ZQ9_RHOPB